MPSAIRTLVRLALAFSMSASTHPAVAQTSGWSAGTGQQSWSPIPPHPPPLRGFSPSTDSAASPLEIGTLYGMSAAYGVGTGIWLDAELGIDDPGLRFLPPVALGLAAPVGVFLLDRPRMPRGMPAAIAAGMAIGAGEGVGIASYQYVRAKAQDEWGFRGFARAVFIGSTAGAALGYVTGAAMEPSPKTSLLLGSGVLWGAAIGSMAGYGGSRAGSDFGVANDAASLGGLIGYNAGLVGLAALSMVWVPSYKSVAWMWMGFGGGVALSLPVYLFYLGSDHDARRGLIVQGAAATLGLVAGAVFTIDSRDYSSTPGSHIAAGASNPVLRITGGGLMPVPGGMGLTLSGLLF
jgi:hypothetical protein